jgi:outer membrane protein assembly factor BamB
VSGHCDGRTGIEGSALRFARRAPVRGRMAHMGSLLVATLDRRGEFSSQGGADLAGIGAFDPSTGEERWAVWGVPELAAVGDHGIYAYSRAGLIVALDAKGRERWRARVPDDRSAGAQARGDRDGPFVADGVLDGALLAVAAGAEVWWLAVGDGQVVAHRPACREERGAIARIARSRDGSIVVTCTERTAWDDETSALEPWLWQPAPTLESLRRASGDIVAFGPDLGERWRLAPPVPGIVYGDLRPAATPDGGIVAVGARAAVDGTSRYLSLSGDWMVALDATSGAVRWQRDMPGGRGRFDPVAGPGGLVAGFEPAFYASTDGVVRWQLPAGRLDLDNRVAPLWDGGRLLFAGRGVILETAVDSGATRILFRFGPCPYVGSVTTNMVMGDGLLYLGVRRPEGSIELCAFALPSSQCAAEAMWPKE